MKVNLTAHPNSKKPRITKDLPNSTHVYVKEPAKQGKANKAIKEALAKHYNVPKSAVKLLHGKNTKNITMVTISITGILLVPAFFIS